MSKSWTTVFLGDLHYPYVDWWALAHALAVCQRYPVARVILLGDVIDAECLASFEECAKSAAQERLGSELGFVPRLIRHLRTTLGKPEIIYVLGNHEDRVRRTLAKKVPGLTGLLTYQDLLRKASRQDLPDQVVPRDRWYDLRGLYALHGFWVRSEAGMTARKHVERLGASLIVGHSHRGGVYYRQVGAQTLRGYENFCLCTTEVPGASPLENWQQGFSILEHTGGEVHQFPLRAMACEGLSPSRVDALRTLLMEGAPA